MSKASRKRMVIGSILLFIAAVHILGPMRRVSGIWHTLYASYFSDLSLPFGFYFLLCASEQKIDLLRRWWVKAGLLFGLACAAEMLQFFGVYALGSTFDPIDILMYAMGTLLAVMVERSLFARWEFW